MDLRFRRLQQAKAVERYSQYSSTLLQESMQHSLVPHVRCADDDHASVHTFSGKWYQVDLLQRICTCGRFQYNDIPCGHAVAVIQRYIPTVLHLQHRNATLETTLPATSQLLLWSPPTHKSCLPSMSVDYECHHSPSCGSAGHLCLKNRRGARRLPALQPGSSEHAVPHMLGHYQTSPTVYSAAAGAERRATMF